MSDFNYPESNGVKDSEGFELSSFLTKGSYRGNMHIPIGDTQSVGDVSSSETGLGAFTNKEQSI